MEADLLVIGRSGKPSWLAADAAVCQCNVLRVHCSTNTSVSGCEYPLQIAENVVQWRVRAMEREGSVMPDTTIVCRLACLQVLLHDGAQNLFQHIGEWGTVVTWLPGKPHLRNTEVLLASVLMVPPDVKHGMRAHLRLCKTRLAAIVPGCLVDDRVEPDWQQLFQVVRWMIVWKGAHTAPPPVQTLVPTSMRLCDVTVTWWLRKPS